MVKAQKTKKLEKKVDSSKKKPEKKVKSGKKQVSLLHFQGFTKSNSDGQIPASPLEVTKFQCQYCTDTFSHVGARKMHEA